MGRWVTRCITKHHPAGAYLAVVCVVYVLCLCVWGAGRRGEVGVGWVGVGGGGAQGRAEDSIRTTGSSSP